MFLRIISLQFSRIYRAHGMKMSRNATTLLNRENCFFFRVCKYTLAGSAAARRTARGACARARALLILHSYFREPRTTRQRVLLIISAPVKNWIFNAAIRQKAHVAILKFSPDTARKARQHASARVSHFPPTGTKLTYLWLILRVSVLFSSLIFSCARITFIRNYNYASVLCPTALRET